MSSTKAFSGYCAVVSRSAQEILHGPNLDARCCGSWHIQQRVLQRAGRVFELGITVAQQCCQSGTVVQSDWERLYHHHAQITKSFWSERSRVLNRLRRTPVTEFSPNLPCSVCKHVSSIYLCPKEALQRQCAAFEASVAEFKTRYPVEFVEAELPELRKAFLAMLMYSCSFNFSGWCN